MLGHRPGPRVTATPSVGREWTVPGVHSYPGGTVARDDARLEGWRRRPAHASGHPLGGASGSRVKRATASMWGVCGNMSTGRTHSSR